MPASAHDPVLILVTGAYDAPAGAAGEAAATAAFHQADIAEPQLIATDFVATRGDGVFETVGVFDGTPVNLGPHLDRLVRSAEMIDLPAPDRAVMEEAFAAAVAAHASVPELTVRISLTRGVEGSGIPSCWIHAREADDYSAARRGISVVTLDRGLPTTVMETSPWLLAGAKTLSYAVNMAVTREAKRRGADDTLFVSSDGYALEGPTSTLLVRFGEDFVTTPAGAGVLAGTSVKTVGEEIVRRGGTFRDELVTPAQILESDGAWLLSSSRLAAPIARLDDQELPVDQALTERFVEVLTGKA